MKRQLTGILIVTAALWATVKQIRCPPGPGFAEQWGTIPISEVTSLGLTVLPGLDPTQNSEPCFRALCTPGKRCLPRPQMLVSDGREPSWALVPDCLGPSPVRTAHWLEGCGHVIQLLWALISSENGEHPSTYCLRGWFYYMN